jgi:hypothetical protein
VFVLLKNKTMPWILRRCIQNGCKFHCRFSAATCAVRKPLFTPQTEFVHKSRFACY